MVSCHPSHRNLKDSALHSAGPAGILALLLLESATRWDHIPSQVTGGPHELALVRVQEDWEHRR